MQNRWYMSRFQECFWQQIGLRCPQLVEWVASSVATTINDAIVRREMVTSILASSFSRYGQDCLYLVQRLSSCSYRMWINAMSEVVNGQNCELLFFDACHCSLRDMS